MPVPPSTLTRRQARRSHLWTPSARELWCRTLIIGAFRDRQALARSEPAMARSATSWYSRRTQPPPPRPSSARAIGSGEIKRAATDRRRAHQSCWNTAVRRAPPLGRPYGYHWRRARIWRRTAPMVRPSFGTVQAVGFRSVIVALAVTAARESSTAIGLMATSWSSINGLPRQNFR